MAIYFISDFHLGVPTIEDSQMREKKLLRFLDSIKPDCEELSSWATSSIFGSNTRP